MAGLGDLLARAGAAGGMVRDIPPTEQGGPMMEEDAEAMPDSPGIDGAISQLDGALDAMDPEVAEEARVHLNAIRELVSKSEVTGPPPEAPVAGEEGPGSQPPSPDDILKGPM